MKICDLHNDFITKLNDEETKKYIRECEAFGVKVLVASIYTTEFTKENALSKVCFFMKKIKNIETKIKLLIHIEDLWFLDDTNLKDFLKLKPFSCGLTWNEDNAIGGGCQSKAGLSKFGKKVISQLLKNGILIDLAHTNKKTFYAAAKIIKTKLFVSHTAFCGVQKHERNIDDEQINLIKKSGGIIGITLVSPFLRAGEGVRSGDLVKHVNYFVEKHGDSALALGTDFYGTINLPQDIKNYSDLAKVGINDNVLYENFIEFLKKF